MKGTGISFARLIGGAQGPQRESLDSDGRIPLNMLVFRVSDSQARLVLNARIRGIRSLGMPEPPHV